jgi:hypothetical protein
VRTLAVLCLALSLSMAAKAQSAPKGNHDPNLQAIDWLTGGTWTADVKTQDGKPFPIQEELRWADTGTAIYFLTRFNGQPHYYGIYVYDPAAKQIKFFYTSSDGEFTSGHAEPGDKELKQDFQSSDSKGTTNYSSVIKRHGDDAYDFAVFTQGSDKPMFTITYVRK